MQTKIYIHTFLIHSNWGFNKGIISILIGTTKIWWIIQNIIHLKYIYATDRAGEY